MVLERSLRRKGLIPRYDTLCAERSALEKMPLFELRTKPVHPCG